jgi:hypothetical protein
VIVLGIDSAELSGFAVVARDPDGRERLEHHGVLTIRSAADVEAAIAALVVHAPDVVAVEEPFVHPRNPATGLTLARLLGRWLQAIEGRGLAAVTIPSTGESLSPRSSRATNRPTSSTFTQAGALATITVRGFTGLSG